MDLGADQDGGEMSHGSYINRLGDFRLDYSGSEYGERAVCCVRFSVT